MVAATSQVRPWRVVSHPRKSLPANLTKWIYDGPRVSSQKTLWLGVNFFAPTAIGKATRCWGAQVVWATKNTVGRELLCFFIFIFSTFFSISLENYVFSSWFDKNLNPTHYSIFLSRVRGFVNWQKESKKRYPLETPQRLMSSCSEILRAWTCRRSVVASYGAVLLREFIGVYASVCLFCVDALNVYCK